MFGMPYVDRRDIRFFQPGVCVEGLEKWRRIEEHPAPIAVVDPQLKVYVVFDGTHRSFVALREWEREGIGLDVCVTAEDIRRFGSSHGASGRARYEAEQFLRKSSENPLYYLKFPDVDGLRVNGTG